MALKYAVPFFCILTTVVSDLCPKQCDCDLYNGLNRAICVDQNIISVNVGVPTAVQVYHLTHNAISELDNFCFKESGYTSIEVLNLSYNHIFWIGLHAFSGLEKLSNLDLSNNGLRYIPSDLFWDTPLLENLDLSSNVFESLKNEPIVMHSNLKVLNLNNCRIKAVPDRVFSRLPNLRKLDLSENYMVTITMEALRPMHKLDRLELRNDYWRCSPELIVVENWISLQGIAYEKQCKRTRPKMSEKIISQVPVEREEIELDKIWNGTVTKNVTNIVTDKVVPLTPLQKFDKEFPALQAFVIGLEIGLALGIVATYLWLRRVCIIPCRFSRPQTHRERRRARMDGDMRASLLWSTLLNPDTETPPPFRRQLSLPDRSPYGIPGVTEARLQVDAIRVPDDRSETPPPPYHDFRSNV